MKQPTDQEITEQATHYDFIANIDKDFQDGFYTGVKWYLNYAKEPFKPLSELADNEEDCNKLALAIYGKPMQPPVRGFMKNGGNGDWFSIETGGRNEYGATLTVYKDGKIVQSGMNGKANIFKIVDEIRNLGYDVQPETKTA